MINLHLRKFLLTLTACMVFACQPVRGAQPDIVFIVVDDLNDWLGCLEVDIRTPSRRTSMPSPPAACSSRRPTVTHRSAAPHVPASITAYIRLRQAPTSTPRAPMRRQIETHQACSSSSWKAVTASLAGAKCSTGTPGNSAMPCSLGPAIHAPPKARTTSTP